MLLNQDTLFPPLAPVTTLKGVSTTSVFQVFFVSQWLIGFNQHKREPIIYHALKILFTFMSVTLLEAFLSFSWLLMVARKSVTGQSKY